MAKKYHYGHYMIGGHKLKKFASKHGRRVQIMQRWTNRHRLRAAGRGFKRK